MFTHARNSELVNMHKGCICWIATSSIFTTGNYPLLEADVVQHILFQNTEPNVMNLTYQMVKAASPRY